VVAFELPNQVVSLYRHDLESGTDYSRIILEFLAYKVLSCVYNYLIGGSLVGIDLAGAKTVPHVLRGYILKKSTCLVVCGLI
jgi:hypothetical protein